VTNVIKLPLASKAGRWAAVRRGNLKGSSDIERALRRRWVPSRGVPE
jgi:hypothetical protein